MWFKINDKFNLVLMNHQSVYIFQRIKHVQKKKKLLEILKCPKWNEMLRLYWNPVSACGDFWCITCNTFFLPAPDKGSGVLCRKWQASQNPDVKWYVIKGLKCSQESNGFFFFFRLLLFLYGDSGLFDNECHSSLWMWLGKFISQTKLFETRVWMTSREMYLPFDYGLS